MESDSCVGDFSRPQKEALETLLVLPCFAVPIHTLCHVRCAGASYHEERTEDAVDDAAQDSPCILAIPVAGFSPSHTVDLNPCLRPIITDFFLLL